ncbi:D-alanine--D-alanine ligase family protein [Amnibacterium kyonggiense]|uniref:D-alanine--D-alanine ligase n=1 Tax=Amnibacterium kyonggiense TaxID=595671 RepID=A0A4R7FRV2_9MICO|nr:D-alanine--D-alanine ligase [Amnibacterium kyonggiense]TDS80557.1 D-alanine--D-alanine ligase [Amnibacterium kyonggiense]
MSRVAVLGGGRSSEHAVSLRSAAAVVEALVAGGHEAVPITIREDGVWCDAAGAFGATAAASLAGALPVLAACDVVLPVLHGAPGEDGAIAALADLAGLPVVGCPAIAGALAMDKHATKAVAAALGIGVAPGLLLLPGDPVPSALPPVVVKPTTAGSSVGVSVVTSPDALEEAVAAARAAGDAVLIERYVRGREVQLAVVERRDGSLTVAPPIEYGVDEGDVFDTSRKYDGTAVVRFPAAVEPGLEAALGDAAARLFRALGCAGLSRFDFFVTEDGFLLNEVNTMPGMTPQSGFPRMCRAAGLDLPALVDELVLVAQERGTSSTKVSSAAR